MSKVKGHEATAKIKVTGLYKRNPLPASTVWNGKSETLETFIGNIEGHVRQQLHMAYILHPELRRLWLKLGDIEKVLLQA
jgi:hypothetical protein